MSEATDPPSDERKSAEVWKRMRGFRRKFVNRKTLVVAFQVLEWVTRIATLLSQLFGGL